MRFDSGCLACGRHWNDAESLHISDFKILCAHTKDCRDKKRRAQLMRDYRVKIEMARKAGT